LSIRAGARRTETIRGVARLKAPVQPRARMPSPSHARPSPSGPSGVRWAGALGLGLALACVVAGVARAEPLATVERNGAFVAVEPYGPGIVRVTIATDRAEAGGAPGYGISGKADPSGWSRRTEAGAEVFASPALRVTVAAEPWPGPPSRMERYFAPSLPPVSVEFATASGQPIARMTGWEKAPHTVAGEKTFKVGASFSDTPQTHYYGLGQNQEGVLDLRGRSIDCRHWYDAPAGEQVCVPFLVTDKGYGVVWDNPSATLVSPGVHDATRFQSEVGERVSFFVITGGGADDLYAGYRRLTGVTPLPPKAAFGLIQSKARYESEAELMDVAEGYRRRGYPLDVMVLDWFYWTRMGQLDIDRTAFPDPQGMNARLHAMGLRSMVSVWPRFERESRYYDELAAKGWFLHDRDGAVVDGLPVRSDRAGALIDSTIPEARRWYWDHIRDNILSQGFDFIWLDETEPDLVPDGDVFSIGSGDRYHNLFPLVHTASVADGSARDRPNVRNMILCRAAYLGAQANGCLFWSSDVNATWEALRRQVPAGLNMTASGIAYWSSDTGGWQSPQGPEAEHPPLVDPAGAAAMPAAYRDYPELFVRWFEYNSLTPTLRVHGERPGTAIWQYGAAAEPILASWLRLRYALIPYLYALGRETTQTGAPFMRALWMDFPADPRVKAIGDEYMLGPAFLVAPVTAQGATRRPVYLPAGADWYDWWTGRRLPGGQMIDAPAPIDRLPIFVRAGSIVPVGEPVPSTATPQKLARIRVYPGRDARFTLYDDDGVTNAYRTGGGLSASLRWDERSRRLSASGRLPTGQDPASLLEVVGAPGGG
jgi:alpha-D-xyloside xylohydrolase